MGNRLLVVGSASLHTFNFIDLVRDGVEAVALATSRMDRHVSYETHCLDFSLGLGLFRTVRHLRDIAKTFRPTVIHVHQANSYALAAVLAFRDSGLPIVLTAWGSDILVNPRRSILLKQMVAYILSHVRVVTADSDHVLNEARKLFGRPLDVCNVNFGVTFESCIAPKEPIIYSNRLHKKLYNIDKIIRTFAGFYAQNPSWKLVIAGEGEGSETLQMLAMELGVSDQVDFIGFVSPEINHDYYCRATIYVSIPSSDSVSLSLVEAMGCGCVPFVSDLPANHELIEAGSNGFIEPDLDAIDLSKYSDVDSEALKRSREAVMVRFSKVENRRRYLELYEKYGLS